MYAHTAKSVVKHLHDFCGSHHFKMKFVDPQTKMEYNFEISKGKIGLICAKESFEVKSNVEDLEMLSLPMALVPMKLVDIMYASAGDGSLYEEHELNFAKEVHNVHVNQEVQVFVKLFKIMRERVTLTLKVGDEYLECYYIDGKLIYIEETDDSYTAVITDLFKFYRARGEYSILSLGTRLERFDFSKFLSHHQGIATKMGKTFNRRNQGYEAV